METYCVKDEPFLEEAAEMFQPDINSDQMNLESPHMYRNIYRPAKLGCRIAKCFFSTSSVVFMGAHRAFKCTGPCRRRQEICLHITS